VLGHASSPTCSVYVDVTLTLSKVKVMDHLNFQQLPISRSISSATFVCSSKLMVDIDSMGPGLELIGARFSNFLLEKVSLQFKLHRMSIFHDIKWPHNLVLPDATVTWLGTLVVLHVLCMLM